MNGMPCYTADIAFQSAWWKPLKAMGATVLNFDLADSEDSNDLHDGGAIEGHGTRIALVFGKPSFTDGLACGPSLFIDAWLPRTDHKQAMLLGGFVERSILSSGCKKTTRYDWLNYKHLYRGLDIQSIDHISSDLNSRGFLLSQNATEKVKSLDYAVSLSRSTLTITLLSGLAIDVGALTYKTYFALQYRRSLLQDRNLLEAISEIEEVFNQHSIHRLPH